jgi:two-component system chemotaxis response regulator CheB
MGTARGKTFLPRVREPAAARFLEEAARERAGLVVVGAPLNAARAAAMFLVGLPATFSLPIVMAFGGAVESHDELCVHLQAHSALPVRTIDDKDPVLGGRVHLAPADYHLFVEDDHFALSMSPAVNGARPSLDVLFESVAEHYGAGAVCVLLGQGGDGADDHDGRRGAQRVRARGGLVIVQNPQTAVVGDARVDEPLIGATDTVLHLSEIAPFVSRLGALELT